MAIFFHFWGQECLYKAKTSQTAATSRYKIAVTSQISTLNAGNAPMMSQCTGNMHGTTLVTPKQAQGSLQNSKYRQKYKTYLYKALFVLRLSTLNTSPLKSLRKLFKKVKNNMVSFDSPLLENWFAMNGLEVNLISIDRDMAF